MPTLAELLLTDAKRPEVVRDCTRVIDEEVSAKRGVSGIAIKVAYKTVKAFKPSIISDVMVLLLPAFVEKMEPYYTRHLEAGGGNFATFCGREANPIADSLLQITDERARRSRHESLVKAYTRLRPQGQRHVAVAMPRIGAMLVRHGA